MKTIMSQSENKNNYLQRIKSKIIILMMIWNYDLSVYSNRMYLEWIYHCVVVTHNEEWAIVTLHSYLLGMKKRNQREEEESEWRRRISSTTGIVSPWKYRPLGERQPILRYCTREVFIMLLKPTNKRSL